MIRRVISRNDVALQCLTAILSNSYLQKHFAARAIISEENIHLFNVDVAFLIADAFIKKAGGENV